MPNITHLNGGGSGSRDRNVDVIEKTRSRRKSGTGSAGKESLRQRQADQGEAHLLGSGQDESKGEDTVEAGYRRLWMGIINQAFKDFCSAAPAESLEASKWFETVDIAYVSQLAGVDEARVVDAYDALARLSPFARNQVFREMMFPGTAK
jgi:hypothetical protein